MITVYEFIWMHAFILLGMYLGIHTPRTAGSHGNSMFNILSNCLFYEAAVPLNILTSNVWGPQFIYNFTNILLYLLSDSHLNVGDVFSPCGFTLHFLNDWEYWALFHVLIRHLNISFGEMSIQIPCPLKYFLKIYFMIIIYFLLW